MFPHRRPSIRVVAFLSAGVAVATAAEGVGEAAVAVITADTFADRVDPILRRHCVGCHGPEVQEGGLRLDSHAGIAAGGGTGPVLLPGAAAESLLVQAIRRLDESLAMPPDGPLVAEEVATIAAWIDAGAPHPAGPLDPPPGPDLATARQHWALQPLVRPRPPGAAGMHPVDAFLEEALAASGLAPTPPADRFTLIRRATFDLVGLPPTAEEIEAFLADAGSDAFDRLLERLLASPHYGEHWGRHWLDVVRYADSNGLDENVAHGNAWRYRDYVIAAFNADKPFADFLREQIAGDLLVQPDDQPARVAELLTATGFLVLGPKVLAEGDERKLLMDVIDEQIDTTGRGFLGLALGCARCHDHKFDPVTQADYYALAGILTSTRTMESLARIAKWNENEVATPEERAVHEAHARQIEEMGRRIDRLVVEARQAVAGDGAAAAEVAEEAFPESVRMELAAVREARRQLEATLPPLPMAMGVRDATPVSARIHLRGSHLTLGREVARGVPAVLELDGPLTIPDDASGRRELAEWLADPRHPLVPRVIANRLWRWHFGRGLVSTPDNFGVTGTPPSNGPLLDWLAAELVDSGWSLKHMHRLIMTSAAWRRSSDPEASSTAAACREHDPDNRLWWRADLRRLEAESIRDSLLLVAGMLDRTMGGSLLHVGNRQFLFDHTSKDETRYDAPRRSVYLPVIRNHLQDAMWLFDCTDGAVSSGDRATSTVASQALWLLNADLPLEAAEAIAAHVLAVRGADTATRTRLLFRHVLGRPPTPAEATWLAGRLDELRAAFAAVADVETTAWTAAAQTLLVSDGFLMVR